MNKPVEDVSIELQERSPKSNEPVVKEVMAIKVSASPKGLPRLSLVCPPPSMTRSKMSMQSMLTHVESNMFAALAAFLALLSMGCEDIRALAIGTPLEVLLEIVLLFSLVVFVVELVVLCYAKKGYCWTFWFPLDLIATVTLLMELHCFQDLMFNENCNLFSPSRDHAAMVGGQAAHAIKVARVLRFLRLTRLVKLYKLLACFEDWYPSVRRVALHLSSKIAESRKQAKAKANVAPGDAESDLQDSFIHA